MSAPFRSRMRAIAGLRSEGGSAPLENCRLMLRGISASPATIRQAAVGVVLGSSDYRSSPAQSAPGQPPRSAVFSDFVADLRLDNHDELVGELGLPQTASDDEVFAHAWMRWGFTIVDHMVGG